MTAEDEYPIVDLVAPHAWKAFTAVCAGDSERVNAACDAIRDCSPTPTAAFWTACCGWARLATGAWDRSPCHCGVEHPPSFVLEAYRADGEPVDSRAVDNGSGVVQAAQFLTAYANGDADVAYAIFMTIGVEQIPGFVTVILTAAGDAARRRYGEGVTTL